MKSKWNEMEAAKFQHDAVEMRAYTSRLIGLDEDLVLHGGGNTSVKATATDLFGEKEEVLYVKGSGWDLATIESAGFAPVKLDVLRRMAELEHLSDGDMVKHQRAAMLDPGAPNPSVEAILHAIIPFQYVDHTHADTVVTLTNTADGAQRVKETYGDRVLIIPYVMPGFVLAKEVARLTRGVDWSKLEGLVLMNHGVFSFADDPRQSYERMMALVDDAECYLRRHGTWGTAQWPDDEEADVEVVCRLRKAVSTAAGAPMFSYLNNSAAAIGFCRLDHVEGIATRGPLTPDHVIRTKRIPLVINDDEVDQAVQAYVQSYQSYFERNKTDGLSCLDPAPRWAVWKNRGIFAFGLSIKDVSIITDITDHTVRCIQWAESLGGWSALPEKDIFDVEYWELEQAKLKKRGRLPPLGGRVAVVTGAASGIGKACVNSLLLRGAAVIAIDINPELNSMFNRSDVHTSVCDVCDSMAVTHSVHAGILAFGGLDIVISNAGVFPVSQTIADMEDSVWSASLELNLSSHQRLLKACIPFLKQGIDPAVVIIGSKNVPAPGPGASAYSAAKAGLNQLARVAALELSEYGIRVNTVHPNAVFDTGIWSDDVLQNRARHYGLSVEQYKKNNLLGAEVTAHDVAELACAMAGPLFAKTTGAQIPIDGGNERVI